LVIEHNNSHFAERVKPGSGRDEKSQNQWPITGFIRIARKMG